MTEKNEKKYPFEACDKIWMLPRELGENDSIEVNGIIYSRFQMGDMDCRCVLVASLLTVMLK